MSYADERIPAVGGFQVLAEVDDVVPVEGVDVLAAGPFALK
jgi:hypothetical protein